MKRSLTPLVAAAAALTLLLGWGTASAMAAEGPILELDSAANTSAAPGGTIDYFLNITSVGDEPTDGSPLVLTATLPPSLRAISANTEIQFPFWDCSANAFPTQTVVCEFAGVQDPRFGFGTRNTRFKLSAEVDPSAAGVLTASFSLQGGGAPPTSTVDPTVISAGVAPFGIDAFDQQVIDPGGSINVQAGGRPDVVSTQIDFNTMTAANPLKGAVWPVEPAKDVFVDLPPGLIGNPTVLERCDPAQLALGNIGGRQFCPAETQVGVTTVFSSEGAVLANPLPLYNVVPPKGVAARFGFNLEGTVVVLDAFLRASDYGITIASRYIPEGLATAGIRTTFWGVPGDPSHDRQRACPGEFGPGYGGPSATDPACAAFALEHGLPNPPYTRPSVAFLRNPTSCTGPGEGLESTLQIDSWFHPGGLAPGGLPALSDPAWRQAASVTHEPPGYPRPRSEWGAPVGTGGCEDVPFEPAIAVRATSNQADSPTGLEFDLTMPQSDDPKTISQADLRTARTTLPAGMTLNPAAAAGLEGCSLADVGLDNSLDPKCPDASKIGTVEIISPDIEDPLKGSIFQAKQFDDPSHSLVAFYTVAKGPGLVIKLAAHVERDPNTGRLTTVFDHNPELPFDRYSLRFDSGPKAPLINPPTCGTKTTEAVFTSWARPHEPVHRQGSFEVTTGPSGQPCPPTPAPFAPKLTGGSLSPLAGTASPFVLRLTREDGEQRLSGLTVSPPEGLSAYLKGVPYCPEAALAAISAAPGTGALQLASPSCPQASQVGTVTAGTGAGPLPFYVNGRVYLAGPYKGAPLSLAIVVPAVGGPFDLGSVVTRAAVHVDPVTARLSVVSDPLPQMIEGIPLGVRDLRVAIDRPDFTLNPTDCSPTSLGAKVTGSEGAVADLSQRFQLAECARLGFKPRLSFRLEGGTRRGENPAFTAVLRARPGNANIAKAQVTLPHTAFLAQEHIRTICTRVQYAAEHCPKGSIYGHARAFTPLLDKPLEGPVYLRSSSHPLPDLVASLGGQIHIDLQGRISSVGEGRIRNTFDVVPDAPVSKFVLRMKGGKKGLIVNSRNLCAGSARASVLLDAQNGRVADTRPKVVASDCGGKARKAREPRR